MIAAAVIIGIGQALLGGKPGVPRVVRRSLLTPRETAFWHILRDAAEPLHVAPQVAMNALLNAESGLDKKRWRTTRNSFQSKVVDFALVDDRGMAMLLIELDDRTHSATKDIARDRMTARAGYRTLRVNGREATNRAALRDAIAEALR